MSIITMNDLMNDLNQDDLKKIATSLGIGKRISRKLELMECIQDFLLHHLQTVVDRLSEDEKLLVAEIAFNETCEPLYYNAKYNRNCPYPPHYHSQQKCTPLLLLVSNQRGNDVTRIPMELIKPLRSLLPPPRNPEYQPLT